MNEWFLGLGIAFDSVAFILTVYYVMRASKVGRMRLIDCILRDGVVYYVIMTAEQVVLLAMVTYARVSDTVSLRIIKSSLTYRIIARVEMAESLVRTTVHILHSPF
jgi:hypothetical protein